MSEGVYEVVFFWLGIGLDWIVVGCFVYNMVPLPTLYILR